MKPIPASDAAVMLSVSVRTVRRAIAKNPNLLAGEVANERGKPTPLVDPERLAKFLRPDRRTSSHTFADACRAADCNPREALLRVLSASARDGVLDGDMLAAFFREIYDGEVVGKIIDGKSVTACSMLRAISDKSHRPRGSWCCFLVRLLHASNVNPLLADMPADYQTCWTLARREAVKSVRFFGGRVIPLSHIEGDTKLVVLPEFVVEAKNSHPELVVEGRAISSLGFKAIPLSSDLMRQLWDFTSPAAPKVKPAALGSATRVIRALREEPMHGDESWQSGDKFGPELKAAAAELKELGVTESKKIVAKFLRAWTRKERDKPPIRIVNQIFCLSAGAR